MTAYYVIYGLFVLFQSTTLGAYATFRGASKKAYQYLGIVSGIGALAFIVFSILHFFIIPWWAALLLIIGTLIFAPTIGMKLGRIPFAGLISSVLAIIFTWLFFAHATYYLHS